MESKSLTESTGSTYSNPATPTWAVVASSSALGATLLFFQFSTISAASKILIAMAVISITTLVLKICLDLKKSNNSNDKNLNTAKEEKTESLGQSSGVFNQYFF